MSKKQEIEKVEAQPPAMPTAFTETPEWKLAESLAQSSFVPQAMRGKPEDCLIAIDMSKRTGMAPMSILQNIYIVHGKPAWSSSFLIACINGSGLFSTRLNWRQEGGEWWAYATGKDGEVYEGPRVSVDMAKKEGWLAKNGSKWQTMPELMLRYRSAAFFARCYCPELTMGLHTEYEVAEFAAPVEVKRQSPLVAPVVEAEIDPLPHVEPEQADDMIAAGFDVVDDLCESVGPDKVTAYLVSIGFLRDGETIAGLTELNAHKIGMKPEAFAKAVKEFAK